MKKILSILAVITTGFYFHSSYAHHSTAATFTEDRTTTIEGVITDFKFRNPHVIIYIDVSNDDGSVTNWMSEGGAATGWRRVGWNASTLNTGDKLRVSGYATIDGSPMVWIREMAYLDKTSNEVMANLSGRSDPVAAFNSNKDAANESVEEALTFIPLKLADGKPNFTGISARNIALMKGGPDSNDPAMPYNATGQTALAAWDLTQDPQVFCEPPGLVRQGGYTTYGQIVRQFDDRIEIEYEEYGGKRTVYFDNQLPSTGELSHLGDSVARYEGDALIIETINLLANASGHRGKPLSDEIRVTEVFTRADDPLYGSQLKVEMTVYDPKFLTESWTISRIKTFKEGYDFIENECVPPIRSQQ